MQFKHPELLYALFLLLIPIIVHLFQLRKFQKVPFTNVAFLKNVTLQTRKSSQLKKWLTLLTRLLLFAAIILAFAQPFTSKNKVFNSKIETVIYLDNSFSMQAKGNQGELMKRAVQDIIDQEDAIGEVSIITNDDVFKNTTIKAIKNDLLQLQYSPNQLNYEAALLKSKKQFSTNETSIKNLIFISDFQQKESPFNPQDDSLINLNVVQLKPINTNNISIDSVFVSKTNASNIELKLNLKNDGSDIENLPISLYNGPDLLAKTSVNIEKEASTIFTISANESINGEIIIEDSSLLFDNNLFFNINNSEKINVLSINENDDSFLSRIYTSTEFNYTSNHINQLNYSSIESQHLIVLNEIKNIPTSLATALNSFTGNGGYVVIIPSEELSIRSYNTLVSAYSVNFNPSNASTKRITTINYSHPLYLNVFDKKVSNFQYPRVNSYYTLNSRNSSSLLQFEDGKPFLIQASNTFIFSSALNTKNSNFKNSPLIVPTLYNIGKLSLKIPDLYYIIGIDNTFDIPITLQQDEILSLELNDLDIIPQQQYFNNKVSITTSETPAISGIYLVKNKENHIENVSYNYNRDESKMMYQDLTNLKNVRYNNSITDVINTIKSESKVNELWKWFVIFALLFLLFEMLILKYFK